MAARFRAKIVPFGVAGEDDLDLEMDSVIIRAKRGLMSCGCQNSLLMPLPIYVRLPQSNNPITSGGSQCHPTHVPFHLPHLRNQNTKIASETNFYQTTSQNKHYQYLAVMTREQCNSLHRKPSILIGTNSSDAYKERERRDNDLVLEDDTFQCLVPKQLHKLDHPYPQAKKAQQLEAIFDDPDQTPKPVN
ncbi:transcription initiation factor TFIID subunit 8 [Striga asiatica]|uniref:Transcription initiation factor TFIID subunit 8 n=1 Tax=Striga asiatica TaxID=4170 RepID=A0A5A7QBT4_STRAF|nr:transcription initiation factor TFIID subunit 8 [Striga asiatica]